MKKLIQLLWMAMLLSCQTIAAHADVIFGPVAYIVFYWPWILLAIVLFITWRILRRYRRK